MQGVVTAILGGGQGLRLWPLTRYRAKPAVPFGGKFRLIDIPISNSLHAGVDHVYVMTQFLSASLHRHIAQTYRFDAFSHGFVHILAAEQGLRSRDWYQGTADAVRQNLDRLLESDPSEVMILSGDQLYLMQLKKFVKSHREREADITVAVKPVPRKEASGLGCMRIDGDGRIVEFVEKPQEASVIDRLALDAAAIERLGLKAEPGMVLASMGIYTFRPTILRKMLKRTPYIDFGKEIIPAAIEEHRVCAYVENSYWRDIGTIRSFHEANLELTDALPALNLYNPRLPIFTHPRFLPGCKVNHSEVSESILCDGAIVAGGRINRSIIGVRAVVETGTQIDRSIVMGATFFRGDPQDRGSMPLGVGRDCEIRNAIIDLDARIGAGSRLVNERNIREADDEHYCIRDGIIVVPKNAEIPPGTVI